MEISTKPENLRWIRVTGESSPKLEGRAQGVLRALVNGLRETLLQAFTQVAAGFERVRQHGAPRRRMRVVETLALGGRRQLMLVLCDEQEYLVGTGAEGVETIVPRLPPTGATAPIATAASSTSASAAKSRTGATLRDTAAPGPWLVTSCKKGIAENRTREPENGARNGVGQELWQ